MQILFIVTLCLKNTYITLFILKIIFIKSINAHKNHLTNPQTNIIITRINIFVVINQINKHKAKTCNHCTYTQNYYKKILFVKYKIFFVLLSIRMIKKQTSFRIRNREDKQKSQYIKKKFKV